LIEEGCVDLFDVDAPETPQTIVAARHAATKAQSPLFASLNKSSSAQGLTWNAAWFNWCQTTPSDYVLRGAPNIDSRCTGTTMRDYLRASDLTHLPEEAIALYDDDTAKGERVLYFGDKLVARDDDDVRSRR
jgi:hypothetical protein